MDSMPSEWITNRLDALLISLESGSRPKGGVRGIKEGVPSIGGEHLTYKGTFDFSSIKYVPKEFARRMNKGHIQKNDILIVKDGATTGKTAFVDEKFPFDNAVVNEHVFVCRPSPLVEPRFLFRYLMSKEGQENILDNFQGSAQGGINLSFAPNTQVPLAPFPEQRRIVAKLEKLLAKVDACQERLNKIPTLLKRFRQSVLAAACSGRLTADWRKKNPDDKLCKKIGEGNPPDELEIPPSWNWLLSSHEFSLVTSGSRGWAKFYSHEGPIFIRVGNLDHDTICLDLSTVQHVVPPSDAEGLRTKIKKGDILISITADVGMVALVENDIGEAYINQHVALARPVGHVDGRYLAYYLAANSGGQWQFKNFQRGMTKVGLGLNDIRSIWIAQPPKAEQNEIVCHVKSLFKIADQIEERYKRAKAHVDKLTQSVLAKAFHGELVPQDLNDEPASALSKHIKEVAV